MGKKDFAQSANRLQTKADTGGADKADIIKEMLKPATSSLQDTQKGNINIPVEEKATAQLLLLLKPSTKAQLIQIAKSRKETTNKLLRKLIEAFIAQESTEE